MWTDSYKKLPMDDPPCSFPFLTERLVAQMVKRLSTMRETWVLSLGRKDPLEKEMAIHSSTIAWKNPMDRGAW